MSALLYMPAFASLCKRQPPIINVSIPLLHVSLQLEAWPNCRQHMGGYTASTVQSHTSCQSRLMNNSFQSTKQPPTHKQGALKARISPYVIIRLCQHVHADKRL